MIGPEDLVLVGLDRNGSPVVDLLHEGAVDENLGHAAAALLLAADPAHRGPGETEDGSRAGDIARVARAFAPDSVDVAVNPLAGIGNHRRPGHGIDGVL